MELNVKKQKVFELLGREENQNLSTEEWLNKLNGEGLNVSRGTFFRYKKEFTQLQSSGELKFENGDSCKLQHIAKVLHVENRVVKEEAPTPKEKEIDIWKHIDEVDKREEVPISKEEDDVEIDFSGSDLTDDEREELNILLDGFKTCRSVFEAMECCRQLDMFVQNKKKKIGKYVKEKVSTLYEWQKLFFTNYGLDKRICFEE
jgi:hypothetical protein